MQSQLFSQEKVVEMTNVANLNAVLVPSPIGEGGKKKKMALKIVTPDGVNGYLAMAFKPEVRQFSSTEAAWKLSMKLGIQRLLIENEEFNKAFSEAVVA